MKITRVFLKAGKVEWIDIAETVGEFHDLLAILEPQDQGFVHATSTEDSSVLISIPVDNIAVVVAGEGIEGLA